MNTEQIKAAASLARALKKCHNADLQIGCYTDIGFLVYPVDEHMPSEESASVIQEWARENTIDVSGNYGLVFDGGAGV